MKVIDFTAARKEREENGSFDALKCMIEDMEAGKIEKPARHALVTMDEDGAVRVYGAGTTDIESIGMFDIGKHYLLSNALGPA